MTVVYHPNFSIHIKKFTQQYWEVSDALAARFRTEIDDAIDRIKTSPHSAGHFLRVNSQIVKEVRRRNLISFPFFVLSAVTEDMLVFRSVIASASDPLTWLKTPQFGKGH